MIIPMYSSAHLDVAYKLYPEKVEDVNWLRRQWTDGEINRCKDYETKNFQRNPTYKEWQGCFLDGSMMKEDPIHNWYKGHLISREKKILSVGCGCGIREIALAKDGECGFITAIDNAPYTESLNQVVSEMDLADRLRFVVMNGKELKFPNCQFDFVISHGVLYCIPDESLEAFFKQMLSMLKPDGRLLISVASNISILLRMSLIIKKIFRKKSVLIGRKQTGWMRSTKHILRFLPQNARLRKISYEGHSLQIPRVFGRNGKFPMIGNFVCWISSNVFPLSNSYILMEIEKS